MVWSSSIVFHKDPYKVEKITICDQIGTPSFYRISHGLDCSIVSGNKILTNHFGQDMSDTFAQDGCTFASLEDAKEMILLAIMKGIV